MEANSFFGDRQRKNFINGHQKTEYKDGEDKKSTNVQHNNKPKINKSTLHTACQSLEIKNKGIPFKGVETNTEMEGK